MESKVSKSAMTNGLIVGLLLSVKFLLSAQKFSFATYLSLVVSIYIVLVLFRLAISFRNKELDGIISYKYSFRYIFQIYFYGSIISSFVIFIYTSYFNHEYLDFLFNETLKMYQAIKFPMDDQKTKFLETFCTPAPYSIANILISIIIGAFWGLILAAFVKKEKNIFE